jgi:hypothetical protein
MTDAPTVSGSTQRPIFPPPPTRAVKARANLTIGTLNMPREVLCFFAKTFQVGPFSPTPELRAAFELHSLG